MTPKYIDIHSHINFKAFESDKDEVIKRALENDTWVINVGSQFSTSKRAVEIANEYQEGVFAIVGLHPIHLEESYHDDEEVGGLGFKTKVEKFDRDAYKEFLKDPKVVAIGECGLDYFHCSLEIIEKQKKTFREHVSLSQESRKPLMLHIRNNPKDPSVNAYQDVLEILKEFPGVKGNVHFFAGTLKEANAFLDFGFTLSFTGVITFTHDYDEVIRNIPLDMIMSETDSPYVAPVPHRGKRNEPVYVKEIVKKIAEIKNLPEPEVAKAIVANAKRVFGI
ncbi:MAG: TatD family hydrolase [Candidatus Pacebacteria bacterium]|nr:TatD family hydrolase [Candidatus Paceibacterota bacterium]